MYAVLDIETTGGKYNEEGITEIAIYRFDGHQIVDQFSSLINPERPIQPFVVNLTGINNDMLRQAPKFYEVAKRIIEITEDCILVAHNALFDNRILTTEFDRLGYSFERETLCTVELSKKLLPDMPSYSLGKLARTLGIPLTDRHRAQGDAKATVSLFKILLAKDTSKEIITQTLQKDPKRQIEPKLLDIVESVPSDLGVYYMHNNKGEIIYIGKNKNIRKKIIQHFTNDNQKSKRIQLEVNSVTFEKTGNELIALLKEFEEIKQNRPKYNKMTSLTKFRHQLVIFVDDNGYINLKIKKTDGRKKTVAAFQNYHQAKTALSKITEENLFCPKLTGIENPDGDCCTHFPLGQCYGACVEKETPTEYNERLRLFLEKLDVHNKSMLVIDRGREMDERSVIWIENGVYKGYGYYNLNHQINTREILTSIINSAKKDRDALYLIQDYLRKHKVLKIINLSPTSVY